MSELRNQTAQGGMDGKQNCFSFLGGKVLLLMMKQCAYQMSFHVIIVIFDHSVNTLEIFLCEENDIHHFDCYKQQAGSCMDSLGSDVK